MVLLAYMISWEWMGYLNKLGKAPNLYMTRFHRYGINAMFILTLLCGKIVAAYHSRGVSALYVGQCSINKLPLATRHTHFSYKSYGKPDTNFAVTISDINEFDELLPSICHDIICHDDPENNRIMALGFIAEVLSITPKFNAYLRKC